MPVCVRVETFNQIDRICLVFEQETFNLIRLSFIVKKRENFLAEPAAAAAVKMRHNLVSFHQQFSFFPSLQKLFSAFSYTFFTFILERFFSIINFFCGAACLHSIWWNFVHVNCFFDAFAPVCVAFSEFILHQVQTYCRCFVYFLCPHTYMARLQFIGEMNTF